jgi:hypothetical protein
MSDQERPWPRVEIWRQPDGAWRWRYVTRDGEERVELPSNEPDSSRDGAVRKASIAYPGVPIEVHEPPPDDPEEGHGPSGRRRRRLRGFVVPALLAVAVVWVVLRVRRLSRPPR